MWDARQGPGDRGAEGAALERRGPPRAGPGGGAALERLEMLRAGPGGGAAGGSGGGRGRGQPRLTVDDILLLHHLLLVLLQEAAVHSEAPGVRGKVLLVHLEVAHQLVVDHLGTWTPVADSSGRFPSLGPFVPCRSQAQPPAPPPGSAQSPSSMRDSTDRVRLRMLRESVDWDRIRRSPSGDSSLKCLGRETARHPDAGRTALPGAGLGRRAGHRLPPPPASTSGPLAGLHRPLSAPCAPPPRGGSPRNVGGGDALG